MLDGQEIDVTVRFLGSGDFSGAPTVIIVGPRAPRVSPSWGQRRGGGNNGIWALEKHPMEFLYGYSVAADLRPGTRYDEVVAALGGHGELVERPGDLRGALARAFEAGRPALVNVLTDPSVAYPRRTNLAYEDASRKRQVCGLGDRSADDNSEGGVWRRGRMSKPCSC